ncbi:MAG: cyanophycin synthetase family protein [Gemmataceae bacterium]
MDILKVQALRGPNIWANFPVLEAWVDLGPYKDSGSDEIPGFNDRLMNWLPSMVEHRCSIGERGGFFERLRRGTYPAHILEHITLELQCLAGTEVGFGRARETAKEGIYKVVVEYEDEQFAKAALEAARRLWRAAVHDEPFDVAGEIEKLRELNRRLSPPPATQAIVTAAKKRRIPVRFLNCEGLIQLGHGARQHRLQGSRTDRTSATAESIARDNHLTQSLLQAIGVPVPSGALADSAEAAWETAQELGLPVSIRPRFRRERRPEWDQLQTKEATQNAYRQASNDGDDPVLVERALAGYVHRLLVTDNRVVAAVRHINNEVSDVSHQLHPANAVRAVEAARAIGLDITTVEVITPDIGRPMEEVGGAVVAVHDQPDLNEFLQPVPDAVHPVASAIVASLFPEGENGRIPVISITGTNGKTTTTRLIAHILARQYSSVGMTCSEGIYIGDRLIEAGDCSGPKSAKVVLQHPEVQAAVLETARGGILREGLGFDKCAVAVVTNIAKADHLGQGDIHTAEQVAKVKRTPVDVVLPKGAAVLNASDPLVADMAQHCRGQVIYFSRDPRHPLIGEHRAAGKRAVSVRHNQIVFADGSRETSLIALDRIPLTHGGRVGFNVENSLAAAAAAWAIDVPLEEIRAGLETFGSVLDQVPGRFNLFDYNGATVIVDYAHNISALEYVLEVLRPFPHGERSAVYAVPGDRSDDVIIYQGELLGNAYDRVIIYEDTELRGRPDGAIFALMRQGLAKGSRVREISEVRGNLRAIEQALTRVRPGELLVIQPEFPDEGADYFRRLINAGAREVTLDRAWASAAELALNVH